jgi:uncharacterized protein YrrD
MLHATKDLLGRTIAATDGDIGHVTDCFFDDEAWVIRYLVVETGTWLSNRKVLVSPMALLEPDWDGGNIPARLTRDQVRNSPGVDTDKPVSRQHEVEFYGYYGYPNYWGGSGYWGAGYYPGAMLTGIGDGGSGPEFLVAQVEQERRAHELEQHGHGNPHLRSCREVTGYHIAALDGEIGHVQDMLIDEDSWAIRYLVVNTSNWWLGHQVLVAPQFITDVSWTDQKVAIDLARQAIQGAPAYEAGLLPDRAQEGLVYGHYGRDGYWLHESPPAIAARKGSPGARQQR